MRVLLDGECIGEDSLRSTRLQIIRRNRGRPSVPHSPGQDWDAGDHRGILGSSQMLPPMLYWMAIKERYTSTVFNCLCG